MQPAILIVDDIPANLLALDAALEPLGLDVVRAGSGEEAVRITASREFAVIVMDVRMPGMDGVEAATLIRRRAEGRDLPIILVSAIDRDLVQIERGYRAGAIDYLLKPLDDQTLRAKVSALIELWHGRQAERQELARRLDELEREALRGRAMQDALDGLDMMVWTTDQTGRPVHGNRRFLAAGGVLSGPGEQLACVQLIHHADRDAAQTRWTGALADGLPVEQIWRGRTNGEDRPFTFRFQPVLEPNGDRAGWICTAHELPADSHQASYWRLLSWLGHELRNPLAALATSMELRRRRGPELTASEEIIARQVRRLQDLAAELARLERLGGEPPTPLHGRAAAEKAGSDFHPRVLIVDDNEDALYAMAELLREEGAEVTTASTGAEALEVAQKFQPDFAMLDIGLPDMDGHELGRRLRRQQGGQTLRLFALSGFGTRQDLESSRDAGFDQHFVKPADLPVLLAALGLS
jgi:CheY-like chemotaxis protein